MHRNSLVYIFGSCLIILFKHLLHTYWRLELLESQTYLRRQTVAIDNSMALQVRAPIMYTLLIPANIDI